MKNESFRMREQLNRTLNSVEGIGRATPEPFMYSRILKRLHQQKSNRWTSITDYVGKPVVIGLMASVIIAIDIIIISPQEKSEPMVNESVAAQYQEYSTISTSFYDVTDDPFAKDLSK